MSENESDRRRAARVEAKLQVALQVPVADGYANLETINVSSAGVYFRSQRFIEPMTKLAMSFEVPTRDGAEPVECEGIVVRTYPEQPEADVQAFEVAAFFTSIDATSRKSLEHYVENSISS